MKEFRYCEYSEVKMEQPPKNIDDDYSEVEDKMKIISRIDQLTNVIDWWRYKGYTISLIPTTGNIHDGHMELLRVAKCYTQRVIVSVFPYPMQYGSKAKEYQKNFKADCDRLEKGQASLVFAPIKEHMFPKGLKKRSFVQVPWFESVFEVNRPGYIGGVATIITELLNIIKPYYLVLGEKDYVHTKIVKTIVEDLRYVVKIATVKTIRNENGLPFSSRNELLSAEDRIKAAEISKVMNDVAERLLNGERDYNVVISEAKDRLIAAGFVPDVRVRDSESLAPLDADSKKAVVLMAAYLGDVRLVDNKVIDLEDTYVVDVSMSGMFDGDSV